MVHGTWYMVHGTWHMVHATWYMVHSTWYMVHGTWYMVHGRAVRGRRGAAATAAVDAGEGGQPRRFSFVSFHELIPYAIDNGNTIYHSPKTCVIHCISCGRMPLNYNENIIIRK